MSAQIISLADYRKAKARKKHAPRCRACRKPGHYFRTCPDDAAYHAMIQRDIAADKERTRRLMAHFDAVQTKRSGES